MDNLHFPEIFDGRVMGFFTGKGIGLDVGHITGRRAFIPAHRGGAAVRVLEEGIGTRADAIVTARRDVLLGVRAADSVPILLYDGSRAIAAMCAGWESTAKGLLKLTVEEMARRFGSDPAQVLVAIGPALKWCCNEVNAEAANAVRGATGRGQYLRRAGGRQMLDLQRASVQQALSVGVEKKNISVVEECTHCMSWKYHSRRAGSRAGWQGGFIGFP
jgi:hypothetical protein